MKWLLMIALVLPLSTFGQLPIPVIPDWLKPSQGANGILHQTQVTLTENNYEIVEANVRGRSRGFKLLGLISFRSASYTDAMTRLYTSAHIRQGRPQALANVVYETTSANFILFSI